MNDRQFLQLMVKYSASSPYKNVMSFVVFCGLMVVTFQQSGDPLFVFSAFVTLFLYLSLQSEVNRRIATEIVRLGDRIEELERRNP